MVGPDLAKALDISAPVAVQLCRYRRPVHQLAPCLRHPLVRCLPGMLGEGTGRIGRDEDVVPLLDERESWKCDADFC